MAKYRKKPVVIEAVQFTHATWSDVCNFMHGSDFHGGYREGEEGLDEAWECHIPTLEGEMKAGLNDWIVKGVNGEFYPVKPDIFEKTYEPVFTDAPDCPDAPCCN